jgi:hypothetical protein
MAMQGDVSTVSVRDLLAWLARRRATGILSLSRGMEVWRFQLRSGRIEMASSTSRERMLGRMLVERGLIDERQLEAALKRGQPAGARLGRTLTRSGLVSPAALTEVLAHKMEGLLVDALSWTDGRFFFDDEARPGRRPAIRTTVDVEAVIARAHTRPLTVTDADVLEVNELTPTPTPTPSPTPLG